MHEDWSRSVFGIYGKLEKLITFLFLLRFSWFLYCIHCREYFQCFKQTKVSVAKISNSFGRSGGLLECIYKTTYGLILILVECGSTDNIPGTHCIRHIYVDCRALKWLSLVGYLHYFSSRYCLWRLIWFLRWNPSETLIFSCFGQLARNTRCMSLEVVVSRLPLIRRRAPQTTPGDANKRNNCHVIIFNSVVLKLIQYCSTVYALFWQLPYLMSGTRFIHQISETVCI